MQDERYAGGLWCHEVLDRLSDYVDQELDAGSRAAVNDHLKVCDVCERFGGEYAALVKRIRETLTATEPLDEDVASRLEARLGTEWGGS